MEKTAIYTAIEKIEKLIDLANFCKTEAAKIKDETSMNRHHGRKSGLIFFRQELVNLLELEKQQIIDAVDWGNRKGYDEHTLTCIHDEDLKYYNEIFNKEV